MLSSMNALIACNPHSRYVVAYSGGRDSHVLLHMLSRLRPCVALHVNHQIHPKANQWQEHCRIQAESLGCDFHAYRVDCSDDLGLGLEAKARNERYTVFRQFLEPNDILLTAHHSADQAESVLLALLRGSGPEGLKGIEPLSPLGKGRLVRPWLSVSPVELSDYAKEHKLSWVTDTSNYDCRYTRNALRFKVLPALIQMDSGFLECASRSAAHCYESSELLQSLIHERHKARFRGLNLDLSGLGELCEAEQKQVLRYFIKQCAGSYPPFNRLEELVRQLKCTSDRIPEIDLENASLRRYNNTLYYVPTASNLHHAEGELIHANVPKPLPKGFEEIWDTGTMPKLKLPTGQILCLDALVAEGLSHPGPFVVKARSGDPSCHIRQRKTSLKSLYQSLRVPPWLRDNYPLLMVDGVVVGLPGLFV